MEWPPSPAETCQVVIVAAFAPGLNVLHLDLFKNAQGKTMSRQPPAIQKGPERQVTCLDDMFPAKDAKVTAGSRRTARKRKEAGP